MAKEDVEAVRCCFAAFDEGDVDGAVAYLHPQVRWDISEAGLIDEGHVHVGREAVESFWRRVIEANPFHHEDKRFIDAGDHVCVLATFHLQGARSGIAQSSSCGYVCTVEDGLATHVRFFWDQGKALEAAGLEEEAISQADA